MATSRAEDAAVAAGQPAKVAAAGEADEDPEETGAAAGAEGTPTARIFGAVMLIAGGTVGAGIIALPVKTSEVGFIPSTVSMAACWAYMVITALLLLEAATWYPGADLVSMAGGTMGSAGSVVTSSLYLFVVYATLTAYVAGGEDIFTHLDAMVLGGGVAPLLGIPGWAVGVALTAVMGGVLLSGTGAVDSVNSWCFMTAMGAYAVLWVLAAPGVDPSHLMWADWSGVADTLPVMVVAFTFHNMIPSLLAYLGSSRHVAVAIMFGTGVPFVMYSLWQVVVLGSNPPGQRLASAPAVVQMLHEAAGVHAMYAVQVFSFLSIVTSYLGVAMGTQTFIADLISTEGSPTAGAYKALSSGGRRAAQLLLTVLPPLAVAVCAPGSFNKALEVSGVLRLGLYGIIPAV
eukprot:CAMPEP_0182872398 /NCGR_PEP_ID=MMETSP0034_2-20130328/11681_1 /TAXON_ID=156128 /ORGANISM="Nephroselmis pyriformis, Strain CCMP717" /LENGTH=401 /DNA_ID=CAMNT_0025004989 /DNA_START=292 /DNA_END=1493 /DNA_ORIENTATION=-